MVYGESAIVMSSSLFDELGIDPEDFEWGALGLCKNMPITSSTDDVFFDRYESDTQTAIATDQICLHCPVLASCFWAGQNGEYGVWGGVYWNGAGKPDKNKNSHKTDEVWDEIRAKVSDHE